MLANQDVVYGAARQLLPAPKGGDFSLYVRAYWKAAVMDGSWMPPAVTRLN